MLIAAALLPFVLGGGGYFAYQQGTILMNRMEVKAEIRSIEEIVETEITLLKEFSEAQQYLPQLDEQKISAFAIIFENMQRISIFIS